MRPDDLFDRVTEWADFEAFLRAKTSGLTLAILSGRRRAGKSYFLRRLAARGLYYQGLQEERTPALERIGHLLAERRGIRAASLRLDDWKTAVGAMLDASRGEPLVLDEYPYLLQRSPELSSALQLLYDERRTGPRQRLILCGSSLSTMQHLLTGSQPLRGRAQIDTRMKPFDFRLARSFWKIRSPRMAFYVDALLGGAAGYRDLVAKRPPEKERDFSEWLGTTLMNPSHALYREDEFLLREDPRLAEQSLYRSILGAVARGERTPTRLGGRVGRDRTALSALLRNLVDAGFLKKEVDVDNARAVTYHVQDPIVRFAQLALVPHRDRLDERQWHPVWKEVEPSFRAQILGPHLEELARRWLRHHATPKTLGGTPARVGTLAVADREHRTPIELDAVALDERHTIIALAEVKATEALRSLADLHRLERARALLGPRAARAKLLMIAMTGFERRLAAAAKGREDIELVGLERLYEGD